MSLYHDAKLSIRAGLVAAHERTLASFSAPGRWWNGDERSAIVAEVRAARCDAGLQDSPVPNTSSAKLSAPAKHVARQVGVTTNKLGPEFYAQALKDGLTDAEYCEIVGIASRAANVDVFARGIGVPSRTLAAPENGEPSRVRPQTARDEGAWVESIPSGHRGKQEAIDTYGSSAVEGAPFIYRALSLVPEEAQGLIELGSSQYVVISEFMDLNFTFEPEISRTQVELLAARVSAINECFY
jgi:hypothetical protein